MTAAMAEAMDAKERARATAWARKVHTSAAVIEWALTLLGVLVGFVGAAAVVMVRASNKASGSAETDVLLDLGLPGVIVLSAGIVGYLVGFFFSMQFRFWGHMVRTSASIDERLNPSSRP